MNGAESKIKAKNLIQTTLKEAIISEKPSQQKSQKSTLALTPKGVDMLKKWKAASGNFDLFFVYAEMDPYTQLGADMALLEENYPFDAESESRMKRDSETNTLGRLIKQGYIIRTFPTGASKPMKEADGDTKSKSDAAFGTLSDALLDLRNAQSKLIIDMGADFVNLFGPDLDAIKQQIEIASKAVEGLAQKMHQQLLQEGKGKSKLSSAEYEKIRKKPEAKDYKWSASEQLYIKKK